MSTDSESVPKPNLQVTDLGGYITKLSNCQPLLEQEVRLLCEKARDIFFNESNVQPVRCPVTVVGDMYVRDHAYSLKFIS